MDSTHGNKIEDDTYGLAVGAIVRHGNKNMKVAGDKDGNKWLVEVWLVDGPDGRPCWSRTKPKKKPALEAVN